MANAALVTQLRETPPLAVLKARLRKYRKEERVEGLENPLVTETSDVSLASDRLHFSLRWDSAEEFESEDGTVLQGVVHRIRVGVREVDAHMIAFVHSSERMLARKSKGATSRALLDRNAQLVPIPGSSRLFAWMENHDLTYIIEGAVRRQNAVVQRVKLNGRFTPNNAEWVAAKATGEVVMLRYEGHDGNEYGAYSDGTYIVSGDGLDEEDMESYFLDRVRPNI